MCSSLVKVDVVDDGGVGLYVWGSLVVGLSVGRLIAVGLVVRIVLVWCWGRVLSEVIDTLLL